MKKVKGKGDREIFKKSDLSKTAAAISIAYALLVCSAIIFALIWSICHEVL